MCLGLPIPMEVRSSVQTMSTLTKRLLSFGPLLASPAFIEQLGSAAPAAGGDGNAVAAAAVMISVIERNLMTYS